MVTTMMRMMRMTSDSLTTSAFIADHEFRNSLKIERAKRHLSQAALAEKCGLSVSTIGRIENSDKPVDYMSMLRYIDALGLQLALKEKPSYMVDEDES